MKLILAQDRPGQRPAELSFEQPRVLIGRDTSCDISFEKDKYPMVSRRHAELSWGGRSWMVADLGSSYGTYLNGQKVSGPVAVTVGHSLQFGTEGPILRVIWFDAVESPLSPEHLSARPESSSAPLTATPTVLRSVASQESAASAGSASSSALPAKLEFADDPSRPPVVLAGATISIGRDPACTVVFETSAAMVSRRHADISRTEKGYVVADNNSFNGTFLNGQRLTEPALLTNGDKIQIGMGGPILVFVSGVTQASSRMDAAVSNLEPQRSEQDFSKTMVAKLDAGQIRSTGLSEPQLIRTFSFSDKASLTIGRDADNDISLDGLQISNRHAKLSLRGGEIFAEDLGSTNGTFVNGVRISRQAVSPSDQIHIGTFLLRCDASGQIAVYDTRAKTRIDAVAVTQDIKSGLGKKLRLLDSVSLSIKPNEFVGLLGPSGAGKSTLLEAMSGARPASAGNVLINNQDLYRHFDSLKQAIGYVPQDDIIHSELTVSKALGYVARLRLSRDVSAAEIKRMIDEVLDVTGLSERRDVPVKRLSGGQRKRVSVAVELITKPQAVFLDEPTTGLDPASEDNMMLLFKQLAESGRTVVMTTHSMENIRLFDKIALLMNGKLVYFGPPEEALEYFDAKDFHEIYHKLERSGEAGTSGGTSESLADIRTKAAESLRQRYFSTPAYKEYVQQPLKELGEMEKTGTRKKTRLGIFGSIRQFFTLSGRYLNVLFKDKLTLFILLAQAPVIALMTFLVVGAEQPRDFVYFALALVAVWFGTSVSARELIRERPIYVRERMFNLGVIPYLLSKLFILGFIVFFQCFLLFVPLKLMDILGLMSMPGELFGAPQFWAMILTAGVGLALGLLISAWVKTSEMATSLVPIILIPQILFSGLAGVPQGVSRAVSMTMPSAWSFDTMKRFSTLDTLEPEGADARGATKGLGLYKFIETENDRTLERTQRDIDDYKRLSGRGTGSGDDLLNEKLVVPEIKRLPKDLSGYVTFLHPWMHDVLNQLILMLMFGVLVIATLIVLRLRDIA
ncbi:MAG: FHA domain-containing protein [Acidobacteria bacterium]|nr:FHA domain-containing protein [Acidobacteriota bacterium]